MRVACLQTNAGPDPEKNLSFIESQIPKAKKLKVKLLALPEVFAVRSRSENLPEIAKASPKIIERFKSLAKKHKMAMLLGSLIESVKGQKKFYNTSYLISENGKVIARYRKIHLFDSNVRQASVRESDYIVSGTKIISVKIMGIICGLSICYDLRFPELYRKLMMRGAELIFIPANFTKVTGEAHWDSLVRARAIENQAFVLAPAQVGVHAGNGIQSYGNSLIVDPWGRVLARGSMNKQELIWADLDFSEQRQLRRRLPALRHARLLTH